MIVFFFLFLLSCGARCLCADRLHFVDRSEQGDVVCYLAFLGTLCREPIFKVKKCLQCGCKRGHWRRKLVIHDAFMKGWQNATAYKLTQTAMINPHSPLWTRKNNSALKMKRLIIMFILPLFLTPVPIWIYSIVGSLNLHFFFLWILCDHLWQFSLDAFGLPQTPGWGTLTREFTANTLMNN